MTTGRGPKGGLRFVQTFLAMAVRRRRRLAARRRSRGDSVFADARDVAIGSRQHQRARRAARARSRGARGILSQPARTEFWNTARRVSQSDRADAPAGARRRRQLPLNATDSTQAAVSFAWNCARSAAVAQRDPHFWRRRDGDRTRRRDGTGYRHRRRPYSQRTHVRRHGRRRSLDARQRGRGVRADLRPRAHAVGRRARARHHHQSKSNALRRQRRGQRLGRFILRRGRVRLEQSRRQLDATRREQVHARVDCLARGRYHADAANDLRGGDLRLEREPGGRVVGRG